MNSVEQFCISPLSSCRPSNPSNDSNPTSRKPASTPTHLLPESYSSTAPLTSPVLSTMLSASSTTPRIQTPSFYNSLIRGFSDSDTPQNSIFTFSLMLKNFDSPVNSFSLAFALKSAANLQCLRTGTQLHSQALMRGLDTHLFVGTTLISMYAECECVEYAENMFDEIPDPNVVTWNALFTAFFRRGCVKRAERVFNLMPAKSPASYNLMLGGYTKMGEFESARKEFEKMLIRDEVSWSTMIVGLAQHGHSDEAF